jgi:DNA-binding transcriptional LysR family regulator
MGVLGVQPGAHEGPRCSSSVDFSHWRTAAPRYVGLGTPDGGGLDVFRKRGKRLLKLLASLSAARVWRTLATAVGNSRVRLRLVFELTHAFFDLVSSGLDLSVRFGGPATPELLAVSSRPTRHGLPMCPADLRDARGLILGDADARQFQLLRGEERAMVRPGNPIAGSAGDFLRTLALHHVRPFLAPHWMSGPQVASGERVRLLPQWQGTAMTLWGVWPNRSFQSAAIRLFLRWMVEQVGCAFAGAARC